MPAEKATGGTLINSRFFCFFVLLFSLAVCLSWTVMEVVK